MKKIVEKKTKEVYPSKAAKMKHEKSESMQERLKEYGKAKTPTVKKMKK
jgi:hypothetical protein